MRTNTEQSTKLEVKNTAKTSNFKITANGTAFQILSSGLYSDKIRAVIRELSCNAYDAHVAANKKHVPIQVTLPTATNLYFKVKDFGTGLDDDQVISLYTNYFASDKRDDNSMIGGFGLGSKSPFAYTDNFTVVAVKNGISRVYNAYLTGGAPAITLLSEQQTNAENGVEVSFEVKKADVEEFRKKSVQVYVWFETKPVVHNPETTLNLIQDYAYIGNYARVPSKKHNASEEKHTYYSAVSKPNVIMGNVKYPLNVDLLLTGDTELKTFVNLNIELRLPIGSVNVAASREELQYDPETKEYLLNTLVDELELFKKFLLNKIAAPNKWEKTVEAYLFSKSLMVENLFYKILEYQPRKMELKLAYQETYANLPHDTGADQNVNVYWYAKDAKGRKVVTNGYYTTGTKQYRAIMLKSKHTSILIGDCLNTQSIIDEYRKEHSQNILFITTSKKTMAAAIKHAEYISTSLGNLPIVYASEYAKKITLTNKKNSSSYQYVELDERIIEMHNVLTNKVEQIKLGDIKDNEKFYVLRDTSITNGDTWYLNDPISDPTHALGSKTINGLSVISDFLTQFVPTTNWNFTTKYFKARPVDVKNLKLAERGWKPFLPELYKKMTTDYASAYAVIQNTYPATVLSSGSTYSPEWLTVLTFVSESLNIKYKDQLRKTFVREGLEKDIDGYAKNKVLVSTTTISDIARRFASTLSGLDPAKKLAVPTSYERSQKVLSKYPSLSVLNPNSLKELLKTNPEHVVNILDVVLM